MNSVIVAYTVRILLPIVLIMSVVMLLRGHHQPGGGFAGGLVAGAGFALIALAEGTGVARRLLAIDPLKLIGIGLGSAVLAAFIGPMVGMAPLAGAWFYLGPLHLGTPLLFDIGVYLLVIGVATSFVFNVMEAEPWTS